MNLSVCVLDHNDYQKLVVEFLSVFIYTDWVFTCTEFIVENKLALNILPRFSESILSSGIYSNGHINTNSKLDKCIWCVRINARNLDTQRKPQS